ncbi:TM2 domain-containing protein [Adlercreutzia aquisgranensis]|uniref:TM2 domain-containing protein n=1 Tax=Adlercreutzia aquisgranensis TaxID=2941323 RepID=UPI0013697322|nr:TM2 domain-containing protein [Adlercreutzia aquisgranensis]
MPPNAADRNVAAVLAILFGAFGVHKFYLRYYVPAFLMLGITLLGGFVSLPLMSWAVWVVAIVEGVIYLTKSQAQFYQTYVANRREWF